MSGKTEIKEFALDKIFEAFNDLRVLIIGDVMIDYYLWGKVERISPEAPVPILHVNRRDKRLGGAANVALNIQALGATPVLCSVIGNDPDGDSFITLLNKAGLENKFILRSDKRITTIKHRVMSGSHHMLRIDEEMDGNLTAEDTASLVHLIKSEIENCDVVIFEDYDKGNITQGLIQEVINHAKLLAIPTVVDPKKKNFLHYHGASLFKPNKKELKEGLKIDSDLGQASELEAAIDLLQSQLFVGSVLITLSEQGVFIKKESEKLHIPAHIREISDVSGAGDTVISIAALCCALNLPARYIAELSNLGGGLVCEHVGVVPVSKETLYKEAVKLTSLK